MSVKKRHKHGNEVSSRLEEIKNESGSGWGGGSAVSSRFGTCVVIDWLDEQTPPELPFETLCKLCIMYINLHST